MWNFIFERSETDKARQNVVVLKAQHIYFVSYLFAESRDRDNIELLVLCIKRRTPEVSSV